MLESAPGRSARSKQLLLLDNGVVFGCMAYVDRNRLRARIVTDPADVLGRSMKNVVCLHFGMTGLVVSALNGGQGSVGAAGDRSSQIPWA